MIRVNSSVSPHYSGVENQESSTIVSDDPAPTTAVRLHPTVRPFFRTPRHDPRRRALADALEVLRIVAGRDADYARTQNGEGFSKSDSSSGHMLSQSTVETALRDKQLAERILRLAARYKRQVLRLRQLDLL